MKRLQITFELQVPDSVTRALVQAYVAEAVEIWGGQRHPDDWSRQEEFKLGTVHVSELPTITRK